MGDNNCEIIGNGANSVCSLVSNASVAESTSFVNTHDSLSPIAHVSTSPINQPQQFTAEYLSQLLKDKKQLGAFPNIFVHLDRLVDEEINKVRLSLFRLDTNKEALVLPDPDGNVVTLQEKVYVPVKEYPDYNFVGRILGPRGMTAKQLEQETGCKIMVRGKGSMRDRNKVKVSEEMSRGKPNWEHLNDDLHILIQCEDTENRAKVKLQRAIEDIKRLLVPAADGEDELKRKQLMELAIINGTYRPASQSKIALQTPRLLTPMTLASPLRSPSLGAPIILSPTRLATAAGSPSSIASSLAACSPLFQGAGADFTTAAGLLYNYSLDPFAGLTYPFANATSFASPLMAAGDYQSLDPQAGAIMHQRKLLGQARDHPYQRTSSSLRPPTS